MSIDFENKINNALYDFYLETDRDNISDSLKENVDNLDDYEKKKRQIIFLVKAKAKQMQNNYLKELVVKFMDGINGNIERPISILKQLIQEKPTLAFYNNLDKLSKEDIIDIIKDKNLIELLEKLDENGQDN